MPRERTITSRTATLRIYQTQTTEGQSREQQKGVPWPKKSTCGEKGGPSWKKAKEKNPTLPKPGPGEKEDHSVEQKGGGAVRGGAKGSAGNDFSSQKSPSAIMILRARQGGEKIVTVAGGTRTGWKHSTGEKKYRRDKRIWDILPPVRGKGGNEGKTGINAHKSRFRPRRTGNRKG